MCDEGFVYCGRPEGQRILEPSKGLSQCYMSISQTPPLKVPQNLQIVSTLENQAQAFAALQIQTIIALLATTQYDISLQDQVLLQAIHFAQSLDTYLRPDSLLVAGRKTHHTVTSHKYVLIVLAQKKITFMLKLMLSIDLQCTYFYTCTDITCENFSWTKHLIKAKGPRTHECHDTALLCSQEPP